MAQQVSKISSPTIPLGTYNRNPDFPDQKPREIYNKIGDKKSASGDNVPIYSPTLHIWKTPKGNMIELDDSGAENAGANKDSLKLDNAGVRLTTRKGHILHLTDQQQMEGIFLSDYANNYFWLETNKSNGYLNINRNYRETIAKNRTAEIGGSAIFRCKESFHVVAQKMIGLNAQSNVMINSSTDNVSVSGMLGVNVHGQAGVNISSGTNASITAATTLVAGGPITFVNGATMVTVESDGSVNIIAGAEINIIAPMINLISG